MKLVISETINDIPVVTEKETTLLISDFDAGGGAVPKSTVTAKGSLIVGTAAATVAELVVGTNGCVLVADSAEDTGTKWIPTSGLVSSDVIRASSLYPYSSPVTDHTAYGIIEEFTAHEAQAFGDVCYINSSGEMALADADAIATSVVMGMAAETIGAGTAGDYLLFGTARDDTWAWTVGGKIFLSTTGTTGNTLTQTAPSGTDDCIVIVGTAIHADRMIFNPEKVIVEHT